MLGVRYLGRRRQRRRGRNAWFQMLSTYVALAMVESSGGSCSRDECLTDVTEGNDRWFAEGAAKCLDKLGPEGRSGRTAATGKASKRGSGGERTTSASWDTSLGLDLSRGTGLHVGLIVDTGHCWRATRAAQPKRSYRGTSCPLSFRNWRWKHSCNQGGRVEDRFLQVEVPVELKWQALLEFPVYHIRHSLWIVARLGGDSALNLGVAVVPFARSG